MSNASLMGMPMIVRSEVIGYHRDQFRFPRTKNRRIRRKWSKRAENYRVWWDDVICRYGRDYLCSPPAYERLLAESRLAAPVQP